MKKIPELRFPEFSGEWEDKNLGDVLIERNVKCKDGDYEVISSTTNGLYYQKDYFNRNIASDDKSGYKILEKEQIVFSPQNLWMGNINFNDSIDIGIVSPSYKIYDIKKNYYPYFIKHIIKTPYMMYQYLQSSEQGASVVRRNLNIELFYSCKVSIPSIEEQKKLANFFNLIDKKIEKQEEKIASIEDYKRGMMQKLFPKKGENIPELRFKGFTDPWEQRKLGEVAEITMGQSPKSENYTDNPNDHILVQGNADMKNGRVLPRVWTTQVTKRAEKNDLILSVRAPVGDVGKTDYNVVLGRGVAGIKGNEFIFHLLTRMKENGYWTNLSTGSTFESINSTDIKEAYILIPNNEEQIKIGEYFNNLDNLITLHQHKLEELKEIKKGFMQKMFI
ncbi:restriction endonuclease subunit S [Tissierella pigra]|uniref:restriction endonuclease subunit S n=1 Tax=Tissierella pigra TaxID=2607614 RepID=UPI001C10F9DA|nr:restriction endonuclease subunit S [Tissierella pigra]MBU5428432.1 restriction endonuclease subunit S [Tissierella pigra]